MSQAQWERDRTALIASLPDKRIVCNADGVTEYCASGEHAGCWSYCCCSCHDTEA